MKHSIGNQPIKRKNPSYIYSILSVALVLFLLGFFLLFLLHAPKWVQDYKEKINVTAEIKDETPQKEVNQLINSLSKIPYIKKESIQFKSKEEIAEEMKEEIGSAESTLSISNPFYNEINFNLRADYVNKDSIELLRQEILQNSFIQDVYFKELFVDQVNKNLQKIGFTALGLGLIFILIAIVLIHNTIRLVMYSNRFLIKNMQLVGASWSFITKPYLNKSLINGFWSGIIAICILIGLILFINFQFPELRLDIWLDDVLGLIIIFVGLILLGIFITLGSTYFVVNKYLKMRLDDLY